jgi:hypothetical protein
MRLINQLYNINDCVHDVWVFDAIYDFNFVAFFNNELIWVFVYFESQINYLSVAVDMIGLQDELCFACAL